MTDEELDQELSNLRLDEELRLLREQEHGPRSFDEDPIGYVKRSATGMKQAFEDTVPFVEPIRKAGYATSAALLKGVDTLAGKDTKPYSDYYAEEQAYDQEQMAKARAESPAWATALGVGGGLAMGLGTPSKYLGPANAVKNAPGFANAMQRIGGIAALSGAERLTSNPNQFLDTEEGGKGALLSGAIQTGVEMISPALNRLNLARMRQISGERAAKAALGQNIKGFRELAQNQGAEGVANKGKMLLESDKFGAPVITFGTDVEEAGRRALNKKYAVINELNRLENGIEAVVPNSVSGQDAADFVRKWAAENLNDLSIHEGKAQRLEELASEFESKGQIPFRKALDYKNAFKAPKFNQPPTSVVEEADIQPMLKAAWGHAMDEAAKRASRVPGAGPLSEEYQAAKRAYGVYKPISRMAEERDLRNLSNRFVSPSDYFAAGTGAMLGGQREAPASLYGAIAGFVNNQLRNRGSAMAAVSAKTVADIMESSPQALGVFTNQLKKALQSGRASFIATHEALMQNPEYQDLIERRLQEGRINYVKKQTDSFGKTSRP